MSAIQPSYTPLKIPAGASRLAEKLVEEASAVWQLPPGECELLYGRAGYLHALLFAAHHLGADDVDGSAVHDVVRDVVQDILAGGAPVTVPCSPSGGGAGGSSSSSPGGGGHARGVAHFPLMYEWHGSQYLGAAHGLSGILLTLLQAARELPDAAAQPLAAEAQSQEPGAAAQAPAGPPLPGRLASVAAQYAGTERAKLAQVHAALDGHDVVSHSLRALLALQRPSGNFPSSLGSEK